MIYIGIDLGGTAIKFGKADSEGNIIEKWEIPTPEDVISAMAGQISSRCDLKEVAGVGMTVPGPIRADGFLPLCPNVAALRDCYPAQMLKAALGEEGAHIRCAAGNDGKLAALGEYTYGAAKNYDSCIMATIGTAIGGGVIINGNMLYGAHDVAGELSHIHVRDDETVQCGCGGYGCLEQVSSGTGLVREARRALERDDTPSVLRELPAEEITAKKILDAGKAGDKLADGVVRFCFGFLGRAFAAMSCIVDPEVFILGGGVSRAGSYLTDIVNEEYVRTLKISKIPAKILLAELGNDAGILGAVACLQ